MDQIEMILSRARDDSHDELVVQSVENAHDSGDETWSPKEPTAVERVSLVPQPLDFARSHTLFFRQMPGPSALHQEQFHVLLLRKWNADGAQYVLGCLEVQMLGFD